MSAQGATDRGSDLFGVFSVLLSVLLHKGRV